jgi:hypothetical protein
MIQISKLKQKKISILCTFKASHFNPTLKPGLTPYRIYEFGYWRGAGRGLQRDVVNLG